jgi:hypothetical protein
MSESKSSSALPISLMNYAVLFSAIGLCQCDTSASDESRTDNDNSGSTALLPSSDWNGPRVCPEGNWQEIGVQCVNDFVSASYQHDSAALLRRLSLVFSKSDRDCIVKVTSSIPESSPGAGDDCQRQGTMTLTAESDALPSSQYN